jgi:quercetin dioxygenase-like cupin family protein
MSRTAKLVAFVAVGLLALPAADLSAGRDPKEAMAAAIHRPDELTWTDGPASLPPGAKVAVLEGDPTRPGPFVMRIKLPDGYKIPPHTHPKPERLTVVSGSFHLGMGDKFDPKHAVPLPAGAYGTWPTGMKHFVWVEGETIVQLHGDGPWAIEYVNPTDDPRNRKR